MLTTTKDAPKSALTASPPSPRRSLSKDLEFVSANQQLEGFSGNITEKIAAHQPDLNEIAASVKRFRAQISSGENRKQNSLIKG